jgi:cobalamin biosynthesis Mg chelatase CobN
MAMQPIDLQTLFTQLDKVAKSQAQQREGLQIQALLQQVQSQKKAEEHVQSVNEAQDMGYGAQKIKDENSNHQQSSDQEKNESEEAQKEAEKSSFRDPTLGRNIDISG